MKRTFQPTWNSLKEHTTPTWFREAKFGIYTHWGVYSVPAAGPNVTWYPYNMYRKGSEQYEHHVKKYGGPEKFGYKDFIPMFTGEKFDPDEWAELFKNAGAQYAGPVGEHHDGFCLWDTEYSEWKATKMGPRRDVVGELAKAIRKQDMKYMVALHHAENWWFYPHWIKEFDTADPQYAGLYGEPHDLDGKVDNDDFFGQSKPSQAFLEMWYGKILEVIDNYEPDMLWFDFGLERIQEQYRKEFLAYYYNKAEEWGRDVLVTYKWHHLVPGTALIDLELGRFDKLTYHEWLTDTTVDDGHGWGYHEGGDFKSLRTLVHYLVENVSKNGYLLLNVGPKPNGEIPDEAKALLNGIGAWLEINGEAIYGTTPWLAYGEGPTKMEKAGYFMEDAEVQFTAKDIRFTAKGNDLYAICLGWPKEQMVVKSFHALYESEIRSVRMLGVDRALEWSLTGEGLKITPPAEKPCESAFVFKIERKPPFE
jgi:alpha-L-fucosidase